MSTFASRDGTTLHMIMTNMMAAEAVGTHGVQFDTRKFVWIGNTTSTPNVTNSWYTSGVTSIEQTKTRELVLGAPAGTAGVIYPTVMNALAMQGALQGKGVDARVLSAISMPTVCETYSRAKAVHHLEAGRVVICAAGTGLPFFTTDTGAALRAAEMNCDALFKGTSVDGVYSADPKSDPGAKRFDRITFNDILARDLRIMDPAAIALARDNGIPVVVFSIRAPGAVLDVLKGSGKFTIVTKD